MADQQNNFPVADIRGRGTYVLILQVAHPARIQVGRLGCFDFRAGVYAYAGSAFGPGGLAARVGRHLKTEKRLRWHIDYLRGISRVSAVWYTVYPVRREHDWARILLQRRGASVPIPGFGSSDCRCKSHLVYFQHTPKIATFRRKIRCCFAEDPRIDQRVVPAGKSPALCLTTRGDFQ